MQVISYLNHLQIFGLRTPLPLSLYHHHLKKNLLTPLSLLPNDLRVLALRHSLPDDHTVIILKSIDYHHNVQFPLKTSRGHG